MGDDYWQSTDDGAEQWTYNTRGDGSLVPYTDSEGDSDENDYNDEQFEENAQAGLPFWQMEQRRNAANNYDVHVEATSFPGGVLHTFTAYWPDNAGDGPNNDAIHSMMRALQTRLRAFLPYPTSMARAWRASLILTLVVEAERGVEEWDPVTLSSRPDCALNKGCENARAPFPNNIVRYNSDAKPFMEGMEAALFERIVDSSELGYIARTSQWHLIRIVEMSLQLSQYPPQRGAGYISFPGSNVLPKLAGVRNPQNDDEFCCLWALSLGLYPTHVNKQGKQIKTTGGKLVPITLKYAPKAQKTTNRTTQDASAQDWEPPTCTSTRNVTAKRAPGAEQSALGTTEGYAVPDGSREPIRFQDLAGI